MEVDWGKSLVVAYTGIVSVFLALGILSLAVSISGYFFKQIEKSKMKKVKSSS